jgi:nucleotide-binding universal stress UspA family protein
MKTIVALIDFSDVTTAVVERAASLAQAFKARLYLIHSVPRQPEVVDLGLVSPTCLRRPTEEEWAAHRTRLMGLCDSMKATGLKVAAAQLRDLAIEKVTEELRLLHADLVIVGSHQHSVLYELFVGSVTREVLRKSPCPVLVVPGEPIIQRGAAVHEALVGDLRT